MTNNYKQIVILHSFDESTKFLNVFQQLDAKYVKIEPNEKSVERSLNILTNLGKTSFIIFLGHGHSIGLDSPESDDFEARIIINIDKANLLFKDQDVLLLSCRSNEFIKRLKSYKNIIGFGNILSSWNEVMDELELENPNNIRNIEPEDIDYFNKSYTCFIVKSIQLLIDEKITFSDLTKYISFFINKEINSILRNKEKKNRTDVAKLFFEFRNNMIYKSNY